MADYTTASGREITFDLSVLTLREFRALFDRKQPQAEEDKVICKVAGLTQDEYLDLSYPEWRRLMAAFFKKAREPVDPN